MARKRPQLEELDDEGFSIEEDTPEDFLEPGDIPALEPPATDGPSDSTALFDAEEPELLNPVWYTRVSKRIVRKVAMGELKPLDATRLNDWLDNLCRQNLGMSIQEATRQQGSAFERVTKSLLECLPEDLDLLEKEYARTDLLTEDVKKKCLSLLSRLRTIQNQARESTVKAWLYVMRDSEGEVLARQRDSEGNGVFHPEWFHVAFFMAWTQNRYPKVLIMAPPGHGKTTCLRWYLADKIGRQPHRRFLGLYDKLDKPTREIPLVARIIESPRYKAIFPQARLLDRLDGAKRTDQQFTVFRPNWSSREPTFEGYSIQSEFNGMGYDELICDDMCPPSVQHHAYLREKVWGNFTAVAQERLRNPLTTQIKMIATPWHEEDVHGRIRSMVSKGQLDGWLVLVDCFQIRDDSQGKAIPLWQGRITTDVLEQKKRFMGSRYNRNYRLEASEDEMRTLRRMWYYNSDPSGPLTTDNDRALLEALRKGEKWLSIDPSATAAAWSSDQGVTEWVFTAGGYLFCPRVWFLHLGAVAMQDWIIRRLYAAAEDGSPYTGIYIEAQGGMKGQCNMWVQAIPDALKSGRIPTGDGDDREIVQMEPYQGEIPQWRLTGTRMGSGAIQNLSKMRRLKECSHFIENGWVKFAGRRLQTNSQRDKVVTYNAAIPGSAMERLQTTMFHFDGTNSSDALDSVTQFLLGFRSKMRDPYAARAAQEEPERIPEDVKAFRAALRKTIDNLGRKRDGVDEELQFAQKAWVA